MRKPIKTLGRVLLACITGLMLIALISIISSLHAPAQAQELSQPNADTLKNPQSDGLELDRVIAVVNQEVITQRELRARIRLIQYRMKQQNAPSSALPKEAVFRKQVLDHMILQRVQLQTAQEEGIASDDTAVAQALEKVARNQHLSLAAYRRAFETAGFSWAAIQRDMQEELAIEALRQKEVDRKITISDIDVDQYLSNPGSKEELAQFMAHSGLPASIEQVHIRHILIRISPHTSEQHARAKLLDIRKKILAGADFAQLARTFSEDGSAAQGGDLGWLSLQDTVPEFAQAANKLATRTLSPLVHTEYGYHLIEVLDRRTLNTKDQMLARERDFARQAIAMRKADQAYGRWLHSLRQSATIQYKLPL